MYGDPLKQALRPVSGEAFLQQRGETTYRGMLLLSKQKSKSSWTISWAWGSFSPRTALNWESSLGAHLLTEKVGLGPFWSVIRYPVWLCGQPIGGTLAPLVKSRLMSRLTRKGEL